MLSMSFISQIELGEGNPIIPVSTVVSQTSFPKTNAAHLSGRFDVVAAAWDHKNGRFVCRPEQRSEQKLKIRVKKILRYVQTRTPTHLFG